MPAEPAAQQSEALQRILAEARLVVAVGSGGVGKTTTSAAMAIAAARLGRRCAVLTIDPARRLAQALGIEKMGNEPRPLPLELTGPGTVDAMMLETAAAFDDLIARLVPDLERRARLLDNRLYQVIARQLGGTHEYMAVERLYALTREHDYDLVVLDTPPSVNALDFLDAPKRLEHFFSERVQRFFIKRESEKKGFIARLRDRAGDIALTLLSKAFGEPFVEEVQDFATAFQGLFGAFRERGVMVNQLLKDPATAFVVVTAPDPVRVTEAMEFAFALDRLDIAPRAFIVNRVHQSGTDAIARLEPAELKAAIDDAALGLSDADAEALADGLERAQRIRASLARRDGEGLLAMAKAAGKELLVVVPELDTEVGDRSAVEHVLEALGAPPAPAVEGERSPT
jgi:anion-transporting  ArsA/GET3 family ATPase